MKPETKQCKNCKNSFIIELDDFSFYEKMQVPVPEKCPQCRQQLRMLFRNFKTLYKRISSMSGKTIISMYNPDAPFPVYDISEWFSDKWNPIEYGIDINWDKSFFEQLYELFNKVPHISIWNRQSENCQYSNFALRSKNCYLIFGCVENEDCDYGHIVWNSRDSVDNLYLFKCESCYECIDCLGSTKLFYSQECESCIDSIGLFDCRNSLSCIGCVGLINKSYCIFNKQVSREEYKEFLLEHPLSERSSIDFILEQRDILRTEIPQRSFFGSHNNNVSGNHIYNAHNVHNSFDIKGGENSKFCFTDKEPIDSYDLSFMGASVESCYESLACGGSNKIVGSQGVNDSHDVYYSDHCQSSDNLFGCYGLTKKSYCILNKQYTKEEYQKLLSKLIEHMKNNNEWGSFFPKELSPFGYNESIVSEYILLSKGEALTQGYEWKENIPSTKGQGTIEYSKLPKDPEKFNDKLTEEVLTCEKCEKNYKLVNREINFYKQNKILIPSLCFNCRHALRMSKRNTRELWDGICVKCNTEIKTSYKPEDQRIYKIYCEKCYQQEVY